MRHPARLRVASIVLGDFEVDVSTASALDREVDVLWVTPKATQLEPALELAPPERVGEAVVVPLLNGVDHVALLRERYEDVLAGAIRVESERVEPGVVHQKSPFARVDFAPGRQQEEIAEELRAAGLAVALAPDEPTLLWEKLAFLAPLALTTTVLGASVGAVQADPEWNPRLMRSHDEAVSVGLAEGATFDPRGAPPHAARVPRRRWAHFDAEGLRCRSAARAGRDRGADRARRPAARDRDGDDGGARQARQSATAGCACVTWAGCPWSARCGFTECPRRSPSRCAPRLVRRRGGTRTTSRRGRRVRRSTTLARW